MEMIGIRENGQKIIRKEVLMLRVGEKPGEFSMKSKGSILLFLLYFYSSFLPKLQLLLVPQCQYQKKKNKTTT